ncbi:MAG TPA: VWA domain-containing protein [Vicinamibacterales bacterium]|nr:VWA domain-containing protein [Vicinamibacterales bacterium]
MRAVMLLLVAAAPMATAAIGIQSSDSSRATVSRPPSTAPASAPRLVTIDVVATDARGRPVEDLKPSDFELREDTGVLPLESVRLVRSRPAEPPGATPASDSPPAAILTAADERLAASRDETRLFGIFLDDYHVEGGANADRVRAALLDLVDHELSPRDLLVVVRPLDSLLTLRLTRDRAAARTAIENFAGRKGDYEPRNAYERDYIAGTPARIDAARNQVALSAINALAVHLGSLADRRKTLIVATESIGRAERRRGQEYLPTVDTILRSANRANVAIYPFDPAPRDDGAAPDENLRRLADDTDGRLIFDAAALRRAAGEPTAYYLLTFHPPHGDDGLFRQVTARVKKPGVRVAGARKGYWTASPDEVLRAAILARLDEPKKVVPPEPAPHVSALIRPWFGMSRGADGKTRVTFVWEPAVRVPGDRNRQLASRLVLTAKASDGTVLFEGPVRPTGPAAMDDPATTPSRATFDVRPGRLRLRMEIQDVTLQVLDRDVRDISVRDLRGDVAVGTPEVLRARNAREFRTLDADAAVPVASREFSRTERLLIRFRAYGSADAPPAVSAKLLGRTGQTIRDLAVTSSSTEGDLEIDLPLASFATGDYAVEVTAKSGARDASDRITFRVTS